MTKECLNKLKPKRDGVINPQNYNFKPENFDALKRYESTEVDRRTWLHVPMYTISLTTFDSFFLQRAFVQI